MNYDFLLPDEKILKEGNANMQQVLGVNKGGKLILTDKRIIFKAHAFNFGSKLDCINLSDIVMTGNTINIFTPSPNMIQIKTTDGNQYQFVVTRKDKEEWLRQISQAADKILNQIDVSEKSEETQPSDPFQVNTVYKEVTRRADLKDQIKKWFTDYKNFKKLTLKQKILKIVIPIIVILAFISLFSPSSDDVNYNGNGTGSIFNSKCVDIIECDNETGAVFDMSMDDLTDKINAACDEIGDYVGQGENDFDISYFWNNMVEPQVDVDVSGKEFTLYSAFLEDVIISATVQDGKITNVRAAFEYDQYEIGDYFGVAAFMSCSGLGVEDASLILETIADGIADGDNTMIYKDGILYSITSIGDSKVAWTVMAADEEFVDSLEYSGNCDLLYW